MNVAEYATASEMRQAYVARKARLWSKPAPVRFIQPVFQQPVDKPVPPPVVVQPATDSPIRTAIMTLCSTKESTDWTLSSIIEAVSAVTGIPYVDIISQHRETKLITARFVYYHIASVYTKKSTPQIAKVCGDRDHSTIVHGRQEAKRRMPALIKTIHAVINRLEWPRESI